VGLSREMNGFKFHILVLGVQLMCLGFSGDG